MYVTEVALIDLWSLETFQVLLLCSQEVLHCTSRSTVELVAEMVRYLWWGWLLLNPFPSRLLVGVKGITAFSWLNSVRVSTLVF